MTVTRKIINPYNAYLARTELTRYVPASNDFQVWTGVTTASVMFAEDDEGVTPIAGMANFAMTESGTAGTYYAQIPTASTNLLIPYDGDTIYQIVRAGANNDIAAVTPLKVTIPRYAQ